MPFEDNAVTVNLRSETEWTRIIDVGEGRSAERTHETHLVGRPTSALGPRNGVRLTIMASQPRIARSMARLMAKPRSGGGRVLPARWAVLLCTEV
jgi:hypothetical protein